MQYMSLTRGNLNAFQVENELRIDASHAINFQKFCQLSSIIVRGKEVIVFPLNTAYKSWGVQLTYTS